MVFTGFGIVVRRLSFNSHRASAVCTTVRFHSVTTNGLNWEGGKEGGGNGGRGGEDRVPQLPGLPRGLICDHASSN